MKVVAFVCATLGWYQLFEGWRDEALGLFVIAAVCLYVARPKKGEVCDE